MASRSTTRRESPRQAAVRLRDEFIARGWPTSAEVGSATGVGSTADAEKWASDRRTASELMGAWSPKERTYRHPDFQFDEAGHLKPAVKKLLAALALHADLTAKADPAGWHKVFWMYGKTYGLADKEGNPRSAADLFATQPEAVIAFALKDATVDVNDIW